MSWFNQCHKSVWIYYYYYIIMSFNLINMSVIFQTYINKILTKLLNDFCIIYLNDILIFFIEKIDHINNVKQILKRLRKFKLYASLKKCKFFITKVNFLKFIIFIKNILMNLSRIDIIKTWFRSKMYWKIQVFLKFINFYWHFIHHYCQIAESLTELLKNSVKDVKMNSFIWLNEVKQAFNIDVSTNSAKIDYKLIKLASVKNICLVELLACKLQQHTHQQLIASYKRLYLLMTVICSKDINCLKDIMRNTCSLFVRFYIQDSYVIK